MRRYKLDNPKRIKKWRIARVLLRKYLRDWKASTPILNCFYHSTKAEYNTLSYVLRFIKGKHNELILNPEEFQFIKDIANARGLKYGKYKYNF